MALNGIMLAKESLNSDGKQVHQNQQTEQPPLTLKSLNRGHVLGQAHKIAELNWLMQSQPYPS